ncbi:RNA polymerase-binding protein DksA [Aquabacterium lacunae]|uniref:RNA polymerase-binding transcription factor DksA n=1 Tax=Aquabacterium lacunae TaxID=2528630 RepID=A0A4Q9GZP8_9BURK|nr:RNA polymerase-binding protein DksA [Aquabacterium lacunae]
MRHPRNVSGSLDKKEVPVTKTTAKTAAPATKKAATKAATAAPKSAASSNSSSESPNKVAKAVKPAPSATQASAKLAEPAVPESKVSKNMPTTATKVDSKLANAWKTKSGAQLTEQELLAMPDAEYMNDKQLEFFRTRLEALKDDLLSNAGETTEHLREDTSIVPDPADRATIEEEHALELRTRDRERKLLKKISQAITRIESGDYGFCDETGEPIGLGRLLARPTATLSIEAQQRRELKQKMFGD